MAINIELMAQGLGITVNALYVLIIASAATLVILYSKIQTEDNKKKFTTGVWVFVVVIIFASGSFTTGNIDVNDVPPPEGKIYEWQTGYHQSAELSMSNYNNDIKDTEYYDIHDPEIVAVAEAISKEAKDSKDAIRLALKYVYDKVDYTWSESDSACFSGTAPEILDSGLGQCDTQSMVVISILRRMGIAAKPVGGCLYPTTGCRLESIFPLNTPKYNELDRPLDAEADVFSRASIQSRKGGLHAWVTAWTPDEGWITLESTTGLIADTKCWNYHVELYVQDENKDDLCVSKSYNYAQGCQSNDLDKMNDYGLGLAEEVSP